MVAAHRSGLTPMIDLMQGTSRLFNRYVRETLKFKSDLLYRGPFGEAFHPEPLATVGPGFHSDWMTNMWNRGEGRRRGVLVARDRPVVVVARAAAVAPRPAARSSRRCAGRWT